LRENVWEISPLDIEPKAGISYAVLGSVLTENIHLSILALGSKPSSSQHFRLIETGIVIPRSRFPRTKTAIPFIYSFQGSFARDSDMAASNRGSIQSTLLTSQIHTPSSEMTFFTSTNGNLALLDDSAQHVQTISNRLTTALDSPRPRLHFQDSRGRFKVMNGAI